MRVTWIVRPRSTRAEACDFVADDLATRLTGGQLDRVEVDVRAATLHRAEEIVNRLALQGADQRRCGDGSGGDRAGVVARDGCAVEERHNNRAVDANATEVNVSHLRIGDVPEV